MLCRIAGAVLPLVIGGLVIDICCNIVDLILREAVLHAERSQEAIYRNRDGICT